MGNLSPPVDIARIVAEARQGDADAVAALVGQCREGATHYALTLLGDHYLAEDAVQEALVNALDALHQLEEPDAFVGWLRKIVFKHCDRIRRQRHMALVALETDLRLQSAEPSPDSGVEAADLRSKILALVETLPEDQREAVRLYYFDALSQAEVGSTTKVPVSTVKNRLRSARHTLKDRIAYMTALNDQKLTAIAPQFLVNDLETASEYYVEKLGFRVDFVYEGFYAGISRDAIVLHLKRAPKTAADRAHRRDNEHLDAYVAVSNVEGLHTEFVARGANVIKPLEVRPWQTKDFYLQDLDGYIICFSENLNNKEAT